MYYVIAHYHELALKGRVVIGRELAARLAPAHLDRSERGQRIAVQRLGVVTRVQPFEVERRAEVFRHPRNLPGRELRRKKSFFSLFLGKIGNEVC